MAKRPTADSLVKAMRQSARTSSRVIDRPVEAGAVSRGRANKHNITGYYALDAKTQFRTICAEKNVSSQQLLGEALNDLFAKYGRPEVIALERA